MTNMRGYSPSEFEKLVIANGYKYSHYDGSHRSYKKEGFPLLLTFPYKHKEVSRPIVRRLIKEHHLIVN